MVCDTFECDTVFVYHQSWTSYMPISKRVKHFDGINHYLVQAAARSNTVSLAQSSLSLLKLSHVE